MWIPHFDKLDSQIGSYAFNTQFCTFKEKGKKEKKGSIQEFNLLQMSPQDYGPWTVIESDP
jgi:hypothetical protein